MVNQDYGQLSRNNDRSSYLKGAGKKKKDHDQEEVVGPILRNGKLLK